MTSTQGAAALSVRCVQKEASLQGRYSMLALLFSSCMDILSPNNKRYLNCCMDPPSSPTNSPRQPKKEEEPKVEIIVGEKKLVADKTYIKGKKKWNDFDLSQSIITALKDQNKMKPTKVQEETLNIALDKDRKKFNILIRAINGSGKTLAFLLPMIAALEPNQVIAEDKTVRGKVMKDEIFKPQGVIIIQNFLLQSQLNEYLKYFREYGDNHDQKALQFKVGILNNDGHKPGDIIVCMMQSFLNRHSRGNMKLDNCKFIAIDEIDDVFKFDPDNLAKLLTIITKERPNLITCSATMEKRFIEFYKGIDPEYITLNVNMDLQKETGQEVTLQGVKNYLKVVPYEDSKGKVYDYIIKELFKEVYGNSEEQKAQIFMFFNSSKDINDFSMRFEELSSDFTTDESKYLQGVTREALAAKVYKDGEKVDLSHLEKEKVMRKFMNRETNILMCSNIMARGIDIRSAVFVINVGAPAKNDGTLDVDSYLHRVGRTGRHNDTGIALTVDNDANIKQLTDLVKKVHKIQIEQMPSEKDLTLEILKCIQHNG